MRSRPTPATTLLSAAATAAALALPGAAVGQDSGQEWLQRCAERGGRGEVYCEVRESVLPATGALEIDAGPNGGVRVTGWDGSEVRLEARVSARDDTLEEATDLAAAVSVVTEGNRVRSTGPRNRNWSVSYEVLVPRRTDLRLETTNGGLDVADVEGRLDLETTNGGISLENVAGDVRGETTNGGLSVRLAGTSWTGSGLDLETNNGGVDLAIPDGYSAHLVARTVNGRITTDVPITLRGELGRRGVEADLGAGGATIRVTTTNGGVRVRRN